MFEVVRLLILVTVVTEQVYYGSSQETTLTLMPGNSEPPYSKVTLENVTSEYYDFMPGCFDGFDKEIEHKQNFGLITITSKLSLRFCSICGLSRMIVEGIISQDKYLDLDITQGIVYLPYVHIKCDLNIQQMVSSWSSRIEGNANKIFANLTIVQADDLSIVSIKHKLMNKPQLDFKPVNSEGWESVSKYFLHDVTIYLTQVMMEKLKTAVPSYLKKVAKEFIVERSSSGEEIPYIELTTTAPTETNVNAIDLNPRCFNFILDDVISKYFYSAQSIRGFDKTLVHTQKFALINVTSELILENCLLNGLQELKPVGVYHVNQVLDFKMTETMVSIPDLWIDCNLEIRQMSSNISSRFQAKSGAIPGNLTIIQNLDLDLVSIKFQVLQEPKIRLIIDNAEVLSFVNRYFSRDLTVYLTKVMSDNLKSTVPKYLNKVAKSFCNL